MSTLTKVFKLSGVLVSVSLAGAIGVLKFFAILFADDDAETPKSSPGMLIGETTLGNAESVTIDDNGVEVGAMSGQPIIRHL